MIIRTTLVLLLFSTALQATTWNLQISTGVVQNFSTKLKFGDSQIDADYETRPFSTPIYYSMLAGFSHWSVELIHQKIFLKNPAGDLQTFAISHGFNLLLVNYEWNVHDWMIGAGGGAVIVHPELDFRNQGYEPGYLFTGPSFQAYVQRRFFLNHSFYLSAEGKFTTGRAHFTIASTPFSAPNVAIHALLGAGWEFGRQNHH